MSRRREHPLDPVARAIALNDVHGYIALALKIAIAVLSLVLGFLIGRWSA